MYKLARDPNYKSIVPYFSTYHHNTNHFSIFTFVNEKNDYENWCIDDKTVLYTLMSPV